MGIVRMYLTSGEGVCKPVPAGEELQRTVTIRKRGIRYAVVGVYTDVQWVSLPGIFDAVSDAILGVEALDITGDDPQADFHFRQTVVGWAHGFAKTGGDCLPGKRPAHKPAQQAGHPCLTGTHQKKTGIDGKGMTDGGQMNPPYRQAGMAQGAVQRFPRYMIPVSSGFIIDQQHQAVIETTGTEMV